MSYILDALRKADAQRERSGQRGIHAQPAPPTDAELGSAGNRAVWIWSATGAGVAAMLVALWMNKPSSPSAQPPAPAPVAAAPAAASPPPGASADSRAPAARITPLAPPPVAQGPTSAAPSSPSNQAPVRSPMRAPALPASVAVASQMPQRPASGAAPPGVQPQAPVAAASAAAPTATQASGARVATVGELPADVQRELPKLAISGGVYSANPAQRMLIVNGQVFNEGADLSSGAVLDQIRPGMAVIRYRGYRYSLSY